MTIAAKDTIRIDGIDRFENIHRNLGYAELFEHEKSCGETELTANGTMSVDTGRFTGRSPKDRFIVKQYPSEENVWWGSVNKGITPEVFDHLYGLATKQLNGKEVYVTDGFCGANPVTRLSVRIVSELAWQSHFCRNMFLRPTEAELKNFESDFTILNACNMTDLDWEKHGLNSEVFVVFNIEKRIAVIGGTSYGGEMKKGIFSMMNYFLPLKKILTMHCSANTGAKGDTALFFGLSGTGKTTLSADPDRALIGDDEHGWDDDGIFNFEGGCYAKTIHLNRETEPDIYQAIRRDALLENVRIDPETREVDYDDCTKTENGRVSYPIYHIDNIVKPVSKGAHPKHIIFLTCDAFGVLPPVSRLTKEQAMYHFISGYTAKVAGTERGITEPQATFSPCFGGPFLTLHPHIYARLLGEKIETHRATAWLVNTGWTGGAHGTGSRMDLPTTRKLITAILDGHLNDAEFESEPVFGLAIPKGLPGVDSKVLNPKNTWTDGAAYDATARTLAEMFIKNHEKYVEADMDFSSAGPRRV